MEGNQRRPGPSFFKVLFSEDCTRRLRLPTAFVREYAEILPKKPLLRASPGESWAVKLEHDTDDRCYFTRGWNKFAERLGIQIGEFLVFSFVGKSTFHVSVYGINGCEREISRCKSEPDDEVEILPREVRNKTAKTSIPRKGASRRHRNAQSSDPLYFEMVLKKYHISRLTINVGFAKASGLIRQRMVVLEFVPKHHFASVALKTSGPSKVDVAWPGFIKKTGMVFGKTYSFEFDPEKNVIQVNEIT